MPGTSIPAATNAIQQFLITVGQSEFFNQQVLFVNECDELLQKIWEVEDYRLRNQIIEAALVNLEWFE